MDLDGDGVISIDEFRKIEDVETCFEHADRSNPMAALSNAPNAKARAKIGTGRSSDATKSWIASLTPDDGTVAAAPMRPTAFRKAPMPTDMPGDVEYLTSTGLAEGKGIWERMAAYIQSRNIDLRLLLDGLDTAQRGFYSITTFRRALGSAFGKQWLELAMTSKEFEEICQPYLTRVPQRPGEPEACIMWQMFANDVMRFSGTLNENDTYFARTAKTIKQSHEQGMAFGGTLA